MSKNDNKIRIYTVYLIGIFSLIVFSTSFAQKELNAMERTGANENIENKVLLTLYSKYFQAYQNVLTYFDYSLGDNIPNLSIEIDERKRLYNEIFIEKSISEDIISSIIQIESYLQNSKGIYASTKFIESLYNKIVVDTESPARLSLETMLPFLNSFALFTCEETQALHKERNEENEKNRFISNQNIWQYEELKINGAQNECIASDNNSGECLVTVKQFNTAIKLIRLRKIYKKRSAYNRILRELLKDEYNAKLLKKDTGDSSLTDGLSQYTTYFNNSEKFKMLGHKVTSKEELFQTYKKYYDQEFKAKEDVHINVLGSSDSTYIDSIYKCLYKEYRNKKKLPYNKIMKKLQWQKSHWDDLPDELVFPTEKTGIGEFTKPIKTPYGYFICSVCDIKRTPYISFEEATDKLIYLATRDKWLNVDSINEAKTYNFYMKNRSEYVTPDTLEMVITLSPYIKDSSYTKSNLNVKKENDKIDSLIDITIKVSSICLPYEIQEKLKNNLKKKKEVSGPIYSRYGKFNFKIYSLKKGGKQIKFNDVYDLILRDLEKNKEKDSVAFAKDKNEFISRKYYAKEYGVKRYKEIKNLPKNVIMKSIKNGDVDISETQIKMELVTKQKLSDDQLIGIGRDQYEINQIKEEGAKFEEWFQNLNIADYYFN